MTSRRLPVGAEIQPGAGGVHFRVWAPGRKTVHVSMQRGEAALAAEGNGYFSGVIPAAEAGTRYRYRLDAGDAYPDPASRFQPEGPHGPSEVVDPAAFEWTDAGWRGVPARGQVLYEMHIGTFTREGTWEAAARALPALAEIGITLLEVMPVAEFPGRFGWGYDGVDLFAPTHLYGTPDDFRRFVARAHALGLGVILDVVYNHVGPDGNFLRHFSPRYFTDRYENDWGEPINYDGEGAAGVREFFVANAGYWIDEFHLDGLRLDATQQIFDASPVNILAEVSRRVREAAAGRETFIVAENEPQLAKLARPASRGGYGIDALWNDDFHHSARVALAGHNEAYYTDYGGTPQEFVSAARHGFLYQGQWYSWQEQPRGSASLDLAPSALVHFIENHDQVANSPRGLRMSQVAAPGCLRAMTALLLLGPQTPMLFQGQEFGSTQPFLFFADHNPELARAVRKGRAEFLTQFPSMASPEAQAALPDPADPATFERCKLDAAARERNVECVALHRDLIALRRADPVFRAARPVDGAVLSAQAFVLRFFGEGGDRLLIVNLGGDLALARAPEPLLAPPEGARWKLAWCSEDARYGGEGTPDPGLGGAWHIPGECALVLISEKA
jgi:maltooligosyltrehalose trehalohydrolase